MITWWKLVFCSSAFLILMSFYSGLIRIHVTDLPSRREEHSPVQLRKATENESGVPGNDSQIIQSESTEDTFYTRKMEGPSRDKKKLQLTENVKQQCLSSLVTVQVGGRFGNLFMEWASALGVARRLDAALPYDQRRVVALPGGIWRPLTDVFDGFRTPSLAEEMQKRKVGDGAASCGEFFPHPDDITAKTTPKWRQAFGDPKRAAGNKSLVLEKWVAFVPSVQSVAEEIRSNVRFKKKFHMQAANRLRSLSDQLSKLDARNRNASEVVLVGMHARRTDYAAWLKGHLQQKPADETYFVRALRWMVWSLRKRKIDIKENESSTEAFALPRYVTPPPPQELPFYPLIAVAVVSDDMRWTNHTLIPALRKYITDEKVSGVRVFAAGSPDAIVDLALLAQCNHTIVSYGTYGATGAILSGGWNVVFDLKHPSYLTLDLAKYFPNWVIMP